MLLAAKSWGYFFNDLDFSFGFAVLGRAGLSNGADGIIGSWAIFFAFRFIHFLGCFLGLAVYGQVYFLLIKSLSSGCLARCSSLIF